MLFVDNSENIALTHDEVLCAVELKLCTRILAIEDFVTLFKDHLLILSAVTGGNHLAVLRFLFAVSGMMIPPTFLLPVQGAQALCLLMVLRS